MFLLHFFSPDRVTAEPLKEAADTIDHCQTTPRNDTQPRIPNIIHQIWKDEDLSTYSLEASHDSWKSIFHGHNYTVKLWTEMDVLNLVKTSYPWLLSAYQSYKYDIQRADIARLVVVHKYGGIYADLDAYPSAPSSAESIPCLQRLGYQAVFAPTSNRGISNHFFMAESDSEFLLWALHEAKRRSASPSRRFMLPYVAVLWSTGPIMVTSVMNEYAWLYNQSRKGKAMAVLEDPFIHSVAHHAAGRYWHGSDGRALNYIADHASDVFFPGLVFFGFAVAVLTIVRRWKQVRPCLDDAIRWFKL